MEPEVHIIEKYFQKNLTLLHYRSHGISNLTEERRKTFLRRLDELK